MKCNQCDHQSTYQTDFANHIKSKHEGMKYACNLCDHQATQQGNLKNHIKSQHDGLWYAVY